MKQKIHYLFMLLLMLLTGVGGVKAQNYELVTDVSSLADGDEVVIGILYKDGNMTKAYVAGDITSQYLQRITDSKFQNTTITSLKEGAIVFKLGKEGDKWTFANSEGKLLGATAEKKMAWAKGTTTWTISIVDGNATIASTNSNFGRILYNANNPRFLYYTSGTTASMLLVQLFKKVESGSSLKDAGLSFESTTATATIGETFTAPTLRNPYNLSVTYASSDANVATVAADGSVSLVGAGTTTITASSEETETYAAGEASYELKVSKAPLVVNPKNVNSNYFVKVTDVTELEDGDAILIVNEDAKKAMSTTQNKNNRGECEVKISNFVIETTENDGTQHLILVEEDGKFYFNTGDREYLYAVSSSDNYLRTGNDCDNNYKAAISIKDGNASIIFQGSNTHNTLRYNSTNKLFSCYASGQQDVQIYKEVPVVAAIGTKKYETLQEAIDAAEAEETIELLKDVDITGYFKSNTDRMPISKSMNINGKSHTVTVAGRGFGVGMNASAKIDVTFQDITILNKTKGARCIDTRGNIGSLTLKKVTLNTQGASGTTQPLTIGGNQADAATVTINNSTIQTNDEGTAYYAIITFNPVKMNISGSTLKGWAAIYAKGVDGSAGSAGSVFNLDGCTLVSSNAYSGNSNSFAAFMVEDNDVTINVKNSEITLNNSGDQIQAIGGASGDTQTDVNIYLGEGNDVTFVEPGNFAFNFNAANVIVSDGTFNVPVPEENCAEGMIPTTLEDGKFSVKVGQYLAQVGEQKFETLAAAVAALTEENNTITLLANVADAYTLTEGQTLNVIRGEYTLTVLAPDGNILQTAEADGVTTYSYSAPVAKIGDAVYASLAAAIEAVPADGTQTTITMVADETIVGNAGVTIPVGKTVVLDLNGKTVTLNVTESKGSQLITNRGTLTITDSSEEQNGKLTNAADESLAVGSWPTNNYVTNVITNSGTLTINAGNIVSTANGSICYAVDNNNTSYDAILNIQGGYLTSVGTVIRQFCNSTTKQNVLNISGGTVETNGYTALWTQLPGSNASNKKLATLNITGGEVKSGTYAWYDYSSGDSFEAVEYSITGGQISGYMYSYAVAKGVKPGFITGGLFTQDVASCCAEGLTIVANTDEATKDEYPFAIGQADIAYSWIQDGTERKEYHLFATPFVNDYLTDGEFITLLKDVTLTENIVCQMTEGSFTFRQGDFNVTKGEYSVSLKTGVTVLTDKQTDIFSAAKAGYKIVESTTEEGYSYTAQLSAPIIFHDEGTYEDALTVAMAGEGTIKYQLGNGAEQTYTAPFTINATTTIKAWTELDGATSDVVTREYKIVEKAKGAVVEDGYYTIKNNGNGKYVNVAGRKTVTFESETADKAGTVIRVKTNDKGQVEVLRSQGVDVPGYADKAMRYVPKIVQLVADKLHAEGSGAILGENGLDAIMTKFNESFDYNLYLEGENNTYRIYGRTPSMKPVVDFYAENKANVDAKLPMLEDFINSAIDKVLAKTGNHGASILTKFILHDVWQNMPGKLTEPTDESSTLKFYEEVLSSETNVWNFAYQTAMIYWGNVKKHPRFDEIKDKLGEYAKYIDKVENIRPNFKYYIVQKDNKLDIISEGNGELNADFTAWTLIPRTDFSVAFNEENVLNNKYYTTLYTDFAYTLPPVGVKAYKVTKVSEAGVAVKVEMKGIIPAQTPVLLEADAADTKVLTLSTEDGTAPADNILVGADALIKQYQIKTAQVESLFELAKKILGESFYNNYVAEYEHLMLRYAGTVNNKYFFGLSQNDMKGMENVRMLNLNEAGENLGFYSNWVSLEANKALIIDSNDPVKLMLKGDVNRDGIVSIADVTALVNIILGKAAYPADADKYDFEAAHVNADEDITIADVTALVNIILGKTQN